ncbi:hypothetical protein B0H11DRAFT_2191778, partial [Mycena galericulata]
MAGTLMTALPNNFEASVLATRYVSSVSLAILVYDHALTFRGEVTAIWMNTGTGVGNRIGFMVNRYLTTAMVAYVSYMLSGLSSGVTTRACRVFIWLFAIASTVFVAISHFIIMARVYTLWDRRILIKWILIVSFSVAISISMAFSILAVHQVQPFLEYTIFLHMCSFTQKPWALSFMLGALTVFDFFIIILTIFNALDRPHQKQAEVMTALQVDGALMFTGIFVLRFISLMMAIFGDPTNCFVTLSLVWAMCSIVNSRIQLRVEGLRFIRHTCLPGETLVMFWLWLWLFGFGLAS